MSGLFAPSATHYFLFTPEFNKFHHRYKSRVLLCSLVLAEQKVGVIFVYC